MTPDPIGHPRTVSVVHQPAVHRHTVIRLLVALLTACAALAGAPQTASADVIPAVTSIAPGSGPLSGGTSVTITGSGFTGATKVTFGTTVRATLIVVSDTQIKTSSPAAAAPGPVPVTVTTAAGQSTTAATFTYYAAPQISALDPASGKYSGGTVVTITGTALAGTTKVTFGGKPGTALTPISDTQLRVTTPAATASGPVPVQVTTPGGVSNSVTFTYAGALVPAVTSVSPSAGPMSGGTSVTITGTGFTGATKVSFGAAVRTTFTLVSDTQIKTTTPAATAPGAVDVRVTTPEGTSPTSTTARFTYLAKPQLTALSPTGGRYSGGTVVTLTGTALTGTTKVMFGTAAGTGLAVLSDTQVRVTAPVASTDGPVAVQATTPGGVSNSLSYTYAAALIPAVTGVSPASGPLGGGTSVTLTGSGFTGATKITFGTATRTTFTIVSDTQIKTTTPAATSPNTVDVRVTTPEGTSPVSTSAKFSYQGGRELCGDLAGSLSVDNLAVWTVTCNVTILPGASVTIASGAVLKMAPATSILVQGSLLARGSATAPVTITSIRDDSVRGDTNGDGTATSPAAADWNAIGADSGSTLLLDNTRIRYGNQIYAWDTVSTTITNSTISQGISVSASRTNSGRPINVSRNTVSAVGAAGAGITVAAYDSIPAATNVAPIVQNNTVTGTTRDNPTDTFGGRAISITANFLDPTRLTGNRGSGNVRNGLFISGRVTANGTFYGGGMPWVIDNAYYGSGLGVAPGATLTIGPSALIKVAPWMTLTVGGALTSSATSAAPAYLTSLNDDNLGGDTNGDGTATKPAAGDWGGVVLTGSGIASLQGVVIRYAG